MFFPGDGMEQEMITIWGDDVDGVAIRTPVGENYVEGVFHSDGEVADRVQWFNTDRRVPRNVVGARVEELKVVDLPEYVKKDAETFVRVEGSEKRKAESASVLNEHFAMKLRNEAEVEKQESETCELRAAPRAGAAGNRK